MASVGIFDYDFFNYENVIPNLECAKLITYLRAHQDIAVLTPKINPEMFGRFITRKEYDDGSFPKILFGPNCEYGGRVFNPDKYQPLEKDIEDTIPDMHIYESFASYFGKKPYQQNQFKRILNCAHMRLAPDSEHLLSYDELKKNLTPNVTGIFLHDYDLAGLKAYDLIKQLQDSRRYKKKEGIYPYPVGNKYPIKVYESSELRKWMQIVTIPNAFFLEYYGLMDDTVLHDLCNDNKRMARQMYYNITYNCQDEHDFLCHRLPLIFKQTLFLRRSGVKILLTYDHNFFVTKELTSLIELLNYWLNFKWQENFMPARQTLFTFCRDIKYLHYTTWAFYTIKMSIEEIRDIFQYIRENNYDLFKMFYEWDAVKLEGGQFVDEWSRNP